MNTLSFALAFFPGGYLAETFFEPMLSESGVLVGSLGQLIGAGPGRGMGFMFLLMGTLSIISALSAFAHPHIRRVEMELPDIE